jgi:carbonic anhydrase
VSTIGLLLERNGAFARSDAHVGVSVIPRLQAFVLTCLDPRVDPAAFLGLRLGDAMVVRNAGGRVTPEVIDDVAFIGFLAEAMIGTDGPLFEVAVVHHNQCGTGFLADEGFRRRFADRSGIDEGKLASEAVVDPESTVRADVARLLSSPRLPARVSVSGHVYDVETGLVRTITSASRAAGISRDLS